MNCLVSRRKTIHDDRTEIYSAGGSEITLADGSSVSVRLIELCGFYGRGSKWWSGGGRSTAVVHHGQEGNNFFGIFPQLE